MWLILLRLGQLVLHLGSPVPLAIHADWHIIDLSDLVVFLDDTALLGVYLDCSLQVLSLVPVLQLLGHHTD